MADRIAIIIPLSRLARDPVLRAFFERSERDNGSTFAVLAPRKPKSPAGAARVLELAGA